MSKFDVATPAEAKLLPHKRRRVPLKADQVWQRNWDEVTALKSPGTVARPKAKKKEPGFFRKWFGKNISNYLRDEEIKKALK